MAPERASRPTDINDESALVESSYDPFAEGNEAATPCEILAYRKTGTAANSPGWTVRVVPNQFPAVGSAGNLEPHRDGLYESMNGIGAHEVIVECPHREPNLSRLSIENIRDVLSVYRDRLVDLNRDPRLAHALIFKNQGAAAGASVHHSHSQLIATPFVPTAIRDELTASQEHYHSHGRNLFDEMIQQELANRSRIVVDTERFVAFCPFASRFAYETWIVPKRPGSHYERIDDAELNDLASVLKTVLCKLEIGLQNPAYNYVLHSAPLHTPELPHYRWQLKILPRLTRVAGFEWGSGCCINEVLPEQAAKVLRETVVVG